MTRRGFIQAVLAAFMAACSRFLPVPEAPALPPVPVSLRFLRTFDPESGRFVNRLDMLYGFSVAQGHNVFIQS